MPSTTTYQWIADGDMLDRFLDDLPTDAPIGMDTEFVRRNTFHARLALLQIGVAGRIALIDPLVVPPSAALRVRLEDQATTCIMHSAGEDIETLSGWLPDGPARLFDTQIAAALAGLGAGMGYQKLVATLAGVELPKGETRSDWLQRPLTDSQCEYAAQDVIHLDTIHATLHERLERLGRLDWLAEDCARLSQRAHVDDIDMQPQRSLRAASGWPRERQAMLRRLLLWRERTAREIDTPRPWLIDDTQALSLAENPPQTRDELAERTRGQRALRGAVRQSLFETLQQPLHDDEIDAAASIPPAPGRADRAALDRLKKAADQIADELDIPAGTLCPRRLLEEYLMTRQWPHALTGWRTPLLRPRLEPLLP